MGDFTKKVDDDEEVTKGEWTAAALSMITEFWSCYCSPENNGRTIAAFFSSGKGLVLLSLGYYSDDLPLCTF